VVGGDIDDRLRGFGQLREDGEGSVTVCMGCGACIGDGGGMCTDPDDREVM
jgi:hypothetical protein